jgi:hypothetical protein
MKEFVASSLPRIRTSAQCEPRNVESIAAQLTALTPAKMKRKSEKMRQKLHAGARGPVL